MPKPRIIINKLSNSIIFIIFFLLCLWHIVLVHLMLADQVLHCRLCFSELHFLHPLVHVPVQEGLPSEHCWEVVVHDLKKLLHRGGIGQIGPMDIEAFRRDITNRRMNVPWYPISPINKVWGIPVLNAENLLIYFLGRHPSPKQESTGYVSTMEGIGPAHPVLPLKQFSGHISQGKRSELNWLRLDKGTIPAMKKCRFGKGMELTHTFLRLVFSWPGNLVEAVIPHMAVETNEFKSG